MDKKFSLRKWLSGQDDQESQNPISRLQSQIDNLFSNFTKTFDSDFLESFENLMLKPRLDIAESDDEYSVSVEIPGVKPDDIKIEVINGELVISGEKKAEKEDRKGKHYHRVERSFGAFRRSITLPGDCDDRGIEAHFDNGVLSLKIPRKPEKKETKRTITITKKP